MCKGTEDVAQKKSGFPTEQEFSGLQGKALKACSLPCPSRAKIMEAIPARCFEKSAMRSLFWALVSSALTALCFLAGVAVYPLNIPPLLKPVVWCLYSVATGTVATGCWVVAHECGHGAFSNSSLLRDAVGYLLHTVLLVPYFSWQRSHAVHHSRTNHLTEGETHVPSLASLEWNHKMYAIAETVGEGPFAVFHLAAVLFVGWPLYLLTGASGGPVRGSTSHFNPKAGNQGANALFPARWHNKVYWSDVGIAAFIAGLGYWAYHRSLMEMATLYLGPYLVVNGWLVFYTWLHHTDVDIPHLPEDKWSWERGAFLTVDRPYGPLIDFLHHSIGSTHVVHHLNHQIPHYHAREATDAIQKAFPDFYLYDPTPIWKAGLRVSSKCIAVTLHDGLAVYRSKNPSKQD